MPSRPSLPSHDVFVKDLVISVAPCSADNYCPICKEEYDENHLPTLLQPCGHIFGKQCIHSWFTKGINICLDRNQLFASYTYTEKDETGPSPPVGEASTQRNSTRFSNARKSEVFRGRSRSMSYLLCLSGEIIAVDGYVTPNGCRRLVRDLWYQIGVLFERLLIHPDELDPLSASDDEIRSSILDALPRGIHVDETAWPAMAHVARIMLNRYSVAYAERFEARMTVEDAMS
ncbi:hypothetical protein COCSADRAFT_101547 [Bipolaris sorokiniana ND90Pr]|uniref:RING-type domain-containing protein n=1 Tax=Cochliobolus sativus (strain ND90Pr / ATCC 201652) TaxID=665912 RepID=M2QW65_COCSN|nr:uncharacterized protein COCSADRAFT_101547 [Bipolaris sorokiniana ND90Pr]EMD59344.1 hypothetical protein COCSADRAFT_101547 [Bipolaris sorokiniana ND90Pr]